MSITKIEPNDIVIDINRYRICHNFLPILHSGFLREMCNTHLKKIMKQEIPYGLDGAEDRQRQCSSIMKNYNEVLFKINLNEDMFAYMLKHENSKKILHDQINVLGCSAFECGNYIFVYMIFGHTM